jgi:hypothetical protein
MQPVSKLYIEKAKTIGGGDNYSKEYPSLNSNAV